MEGVWLGLIFKENYNLLGGKTKTSYIISQPIVIVYFSATGALTRCIRIVLGKQPRRDNFTADVVFYFKQ
jgi:hypothetical protein